MHDNACPHVARVEQECILEAGIGVMDWPSIFLDLNHI